MAARSGQAEVVRYLVQDGAQVEAKAKVRATHESVCYWGGKNPDFITTFKHMHALLKEYFHKVMTKVLSMWYCKKKKKNPNTFVHSIIWQN